MRKELILCDHCGESISLLDNGTPLGFKTQGSLAVSGSESRSNGILAGIQGSLTVLKSGEYCSCRCFQADVSKQILSMEERLMTQLR